MKPDEFTELIEKAILNALDAKMNELVFGAANPEPYLINGTMIKPINAGWKDEDLDELLPAIRNHAEALWNRYDLAGK